MKPLIGSGSIREEIANLQCPYPGDLNYFRGWEGALRAAGDVLERLHQINISRQSEIKIVGYMRRDDEHPFGEFTIPTSGAIPEHGWEPVVTLAAALAALHGLANTVDATEILRRRDFGVLHHDSLGLLSTILAICAESADIDELPGFQALEQRIERELGAITRARLATPNARLSGAGTASA